MTAQLDALRASMARLRRIVGSMDESQLDLHAYPTEWTVADVLSHLGSGAVIWQRMFDDALAGQETPADFNQSVWDEWNAKPSPQRTADALVAGEAFLGRLGSLTEEGRAGFHLSVGPMMWGFDQVVGARLNELAVHTWDVEVALDPQATVGPEAVPIVVDNLAMIAAFTGKPLGGEGGISVRTTEPRRDFHIVLTSDSVSLGSGEPGVTVDLEIPAEAFIRLVYGRLDPDHTPAVTGPADLAKLRRIFPGP